MIADAIDAAISVGWALLAWIVLTAVVATAALYAVAVSVWAVGRFIWLTLSAAWAAAASFRTHSRRCGASRGDGGGFPLPALERAADRRSGPRAHTAPSWARTDTEEAA